MESKNRKMGAKCKKRKKWGKLISYKEQRKITQILKK